MPPNQISRKRRTQKTIERLRQEDRAQDREKLKRLEALVNRSEDDLEKDNDLEELLDEMDTSEWNGQAVNDATESGPSTSNKYQQGDGSSSSQQTAALPQQEQNQSEGSRPSDGTQATESQLQQVPVQQTSADSQAQARQHHTQQNNTQRNGAQPTTAPSQTQGRPDPPQQDNTQQTVPQIKVEAEDDSSSLFVPETSEEEVPGYGSPLLTRPGSGPGGDKTTVGWTGLRGTKYINRYGKKSAARYRLESFADDLYDEYNLPEEQNVSNHDNRLGDQKIGTAWKYTSRHMKHIYGVAWMSDKADPSEDDLKLIDPDQNRKRWVKTYILVAWEIPDEAGKKFITLKWEPRSALRARWGTKQADKAIYQAACQAETRYKEGTTGVRATSDRTPSVGLNDEFTRRMREQSLAARSATTPQPVGNALKESSVKARRERGERLAQWKEDYLMIADVESFSDLNSEDKENMMAAWIRYSSSFVAG